MWCFGEKKNAAQREYFRRGLGVMCSYFLLLFAATITVHHLHPQGWLLYFAALLPSIAILGLLVVVAQYLRNERDEYQRDLVIRCLLWGIAAMLAVETFSSFLRSFGWPGKLPPFTGFYVFCISMIVAKFTYKYRDRITSNDE